MSNLARSTCSSPAVMAEVSRAAVRCGRVRAATGAAGRRDVAAGLAFGGCDLPLRLTLAAALMTDLKAAFFRRTAVRAGGRAAVTRGRDLVGADFFEATRRLTLAIWQRTPRRRGRTAGAGLSDSGFSSVIRQALGTPFRGKERDPVETGLIDIGRRGDRHRV